MQGKTPVQDPPGHISQICSDPALSDSIRAPLRGEVDDSSARNLKGYAMPEQPPVPEVEPSVYTKQEAATYLHTSERHIERLVEQGAIGHCRVGRFVMFSSEDLADYLDRTHVAPKEVR